MSSFRGGTLDFAATNLIPNFPSICFHLTYATAPNAKREASQNTTRLGFPTTSAGVRLRSNLTSLSFTTSSSRLIHICFDVGGILSSQSSPSCQSSCRAIFNLTTMAAANPTGS